MPRVRCERTKRPRREEGIFALDRCCSRGGREEGMGKETKRARLFDEFLTRKGEFGKAFTARERGFLYVWRIGGVFGFRLWQPFSAWGRL